MGKKKMYKSNDRKVCGVCGGLAEYFGIDPTIVRLVYAILAITYGSGLLLYIIAAIIMEDRPDYAGREWIKEVFERTFDKRTLSRVLFSYIKSGIFWYLWLFYCKRLHYML